MLPSLGTCPWYGSNFRADLFPALRGEGDRQGRYAFQWFFHELRSRCHGSYQDLLETTAFATKTLSVVKFKVAFLCLAAGTVELGCLG